MYLILVVSLAVWPGGLQQRADALTARQAAAADTLWADVQQSVIRWRGTKFWGMGQHEGTVHLATGHLQMKAGRLRGGVFVVDMRSIAVTDIPVHEPVPRRRLRNHLMSDDFFAVATYPTAVFELTRVAPRQGRTHAITGNLTVRGQTHPITFEAEVDATAPDHVEATAQFSIDRQRWGVAYRGSRLTDDLVDDAIHLDLHLVARR